MSFKFVLEPRNRSYEGVIILHPEASVEDQQAVFKKNKTILESFKGEIQAVESWGKRKLANPINKQRMGTYFYCIFTADSQAVKELERNLKINDKVFRFLFTRLDDKMDAQKHHDNYRTLLVDSQKRHKEAEEKAALKKQRRTGGHR